MGVFKSNPTYEKSKTNVIKLSRDNILDLILENKKYLKDNGSYKICPIIMESLKSYNLKMYEEYSEDEKKIYSPNNF